MFKSSIHPGFDS